MRCLPHVSSILIRHNETPRRNTDPSTFTIISCYPYIFFIVAHVFPTQKPILVEVYCTDIRKSWGKISSHAKWKTESVPPLTDAFILATEIHKRYYIPSLNSYHLPLSYQWDDTSGSDATRVKKLRRQPASSPGASANSPQLSVLSADIPPVNALPSSLDQQLAN